MPLDEATRAVAFPEVILYFERLDECTEELLDAIKDEIPGPSANSRPIMDEYTLNRLERHNDGHRDMIKLRRIRRALFYLTAEKQRVPLVMKEIGWADDEDAIDSNKHILLKEVGTRKLEAVIMKGEKSAHWVAMRLEMVDFEAREAAEIQDDKLPPMVKYRKVKAWRDQQDLTEAPYLVECYLTPPPELDNLTRLPEKDKDETIRANKDVLAQHEKLREIVPTDPSSSSASSSAPSSGEISQARRFNFPPRDKRPQDPRLRRKRRVSTQLAAPLLSPSSKMSSPDSFDSGISPDYDHSSRSEDYSAEKKRQEEIANRCKSMAIVNDCQLRLARGGVSVVEIEQMQRRLEGESREYADVRELDEKLCALLIVKKPEEEERDILDKKTIAEVLAANYDYGEDEDEEEISFEPESVCSSPHGEISGWSREDDDDLFEMVRGSDEAEMPSDTDDDRPYSPSQPTPTPPLDIGDDVLENPEDAPSPLPEDDSDIPVITIEVITLDDDDDVAAPEHIPNPPFSSPAVQEEGTGDTTDLNIVATQSDDLDSPFVENDTQYLEDMVVLEVGREETVEELVDSEEDAFEDPQESGDYAPEDHEHTTEDPIDIEKSNTATPDDPEEAKEESAENLPEDISADRTELSSGDPDQGLVLEEAVDPDLGKQEFDQSLQDLSPDPLAQIDDQDGSEDSEEDKKKSEQHTADLSDDHLVDGHDRDERDSVEDQREEESDCEEEDDDGREEGELSDSSLEDGELRDDLDDDEAMREREEGELRDDQEVEKVIKEREEGEILDSSQDVALEGIQQEERSPTPPPLAAVPMVPAPAAPDALPLCPPVVFLPFRITALLAPAASDAPVRYTGSYSSSSSSSTPMTSTSVFPPIDDQIIPTYMNQENPAKRRRLSGSSFWQPLKEF